jgi:hypothetical protein
MYGHQRSAPSAGSDQRKQALSAARARIGSGSLLAATGPCLAMASASSTGRIASQATLLSNALYTSDGEQDGLTITCVSRSKFP